MTDTAFQPRAFWQALGLNAVWMNVSEVLRYFWVVKPMVAADFAIVPGIVPSSAGIALLWTAWDALLIVVTTFICWLVLERFGTRRRVAVAAGTLVWATVFVLLWLGMHNMGLATPRTIAAALPLAWAELAIAAMIVRSRMTAAPVSATR